MPPSEQNSTPENQSISNVPEYLHLDPIDPASLQPKKSRKKLVVIIVAAVILIGAIGAVAYVWLSSREQGFYAALDKQLQTEYVIQQITAAADNPKAEMTMNILSQFGVGVAPKSDVTYSLSRPDVKVGTPPEGFVLKGETIITAPTTFYGKLTESPVFETSAPVVVDKWYVVASDNSLDVRLFDAVDARSFVQTFVGGLPIGNYDKDSRAKIIKYIIENKIYTVTQIGGDEVGGKKATVYTLKTTAGKLNGLHIEMNKLVDITPPVKLGDKAAAIESELTVWVDDATGQVIKTTQSDDGSSYGVTFNYGQDKAIDQPADAAMRRSNEAKK